MAEKGESSHEGAKASGLTPHTKSIAIDDAPSSPTHKPAKKKKKKTTSTNTAPETEEAPPKKTAIPKTAPEAEKAPPNTRKKKTFSESANDSGTHAGESNLRKPLVNGNVWQNLDTFAKALDLKTAQQVLDWMASPVFTEDYDQLYDNIIVPRQQRRDGLTGAKANALTKGPDLKVTLASLTAGEAHGGRKFSNPKKKNWKEVDHYAYCLYRLYKANTEDWNGIFYGKSLSETDAYGRLWQAMVRSTHIRNVKAKREAKEAAERRAAIDVRQEDATIFADDAFNKRQKTSDGHKKRTSLAHGTQDVDMLEEAVSEPKSKHKGKAPAKPDKGATIKREKILKAQRKANQSATNSDSESILPLDEDVMEIDSDIGEGSHATDTSEDEEEAPAMTPQELEEALAVVDEDEPMFGDGAIGTPMEMLRLTMNEEKPFDLTTAYGQYITMHIVNHMNGDVAKLQRIVRGGFKAGDLIPLEEASPEDQKAALEKHTASLEEQAKFNTMMWNKEMDSMLGKQSNLNLDDSADTEKAAIKKKMEKLMDNPKLQPKDFQGSCERTGIDPGTCCLPNMNPTVYFKTWQVTGIARIDEIYCDPRTRSALLADETGLGKSWEIMGFWHKCILDRANSTKKYKALKKNYDTMVNLARQWLEDNANEDEDDNPHVVPDEPVAPVKAKPKLLLCLNDLIDQWCGEIREYSTDLEPMAYYGDKRATKSTDIYTKIEGLLTKDHSIFDGSEGNSNIIVVSSVLTFAARHGPGAQLLWHANGKRKTWTQKQRVAVDSVLDPEWIHNLSGMFDIVTIDEAHVIKNLDTKSNRTMLWLQAQFYLLATASLLPNRVDDIEGYIPFFGIPDSMWEPDNLAKLKVSDNKVNPYHLPDDHPGAILRLTLYAVKAWITHKDVLAETSGLRLRKLLEMVTIRRTYASPDPSPPKENPNKTIGESIAWECNRRIECTYNSKELATYKNLTVVPMSKLVVMVGKKVVWNRKYSRQLILLSTWFGFHWIHNDITAKTTKLWKESDNLLYDWIALLHHRMEQPGGEGATFEMPEKDDIIGLLRIACLGSPKLRATLRLVAEVVVLGRKKLVIWSALPASQLFLHAVFQALGIKDAVYSSELTRGERGKLVVEFTQKLATTIWNGNWHVGSAGLNLQPMAYHCLDWDSACNEGQKKQGHGRIRRCGQCHTCEFFEVYVKGSFQNRIMSNSLNKAIPGSIAELSYNIDAGASDSLKEDDSNIEVEGRWHLVDGDLIEESDPRIEAHPGSKPLRPDQLVAAIQSIACGSVNDADNAKKEGDGDEEWADEDTSGDDVRNLARELKQLGLIKDKPAVELTLGNPIPVPDPLQLLLSRFT